MTFRPQAIAVVVCIAAAAFPPAVLAYPASIPIRDFSSKLASDDLVILDVRNVGRDQPVWYNFYYPEVYDRFQVKMIDNSIQVVRTCPGYTGIKCNTASINSLDKLHDFTSASGSDHYDMRLYLTTDFMWIEVWPAGMPNSTVRNTLFFFGPTYDVYNYMMNNRDAGARYGSLADLKADIQANYATPFDPRSPGRFFYTRRGWAAAASSVM